MIVVGLMSGTSLDGIDAALVRLEPQARGYAIDLLRFETFPFDRELARSLFDALPPNAGSVERAADLHVTLGRAFAAAARTVAGSVHVDFVASHGQTVWHDGPRHVTLQLGDAFAIREAMRATVCYDFRSADCAAGGHGAPLVPYVDALLFADEREDRVALNLGGIANVTLLPAGGRVWAFDTGPANINIDAFVAGGRAGRCAATKTERWPLADASTKGCSNPCSPTATSPWRRPKRPGASTSVRRFCFASSRSYRTCRSRTVRRRSPN